MRGGTLPLSKVTSCVVKSVSDARVRLELARGCFGEESPQMALLVQMHSSAAMLAWIDLLRAVQEDQRQREAWHAAGSRGHAPEGLLMDTSARTSELGAGGDHGDEPTGGGEKRPKWGLRSSLRRITALTRPLGGGKKKRIAERKAREGAAGPADAAGAAGAANPASLEEAAVSAVSAVSASAGEAETATLIELAVVQSASAAEGGAEASTGLPLIDSFEAAASTGAAGTSAAATSVAATSAEQSFDVEIASDVAPPVTSGRFAAAAVVARGLGLDATDGAFAAAAEVARGLQQLSQQQKLRLYALYKQSTVGDAPQVSPAGRFDPTAQYKWKAWAGLRGVAQPAAKRQYAHAVGELVAAQSGGQASPAAAASPDNASTLGSS